MNKIVLFALVFIQVFFFKLPAQDSMLHKNRLRNVAIAEVSILAASFIGLNEIWYKDYPRSSFHFFNDADEWLQVDKAGHVFTSYALGVQGIHLFRWCGMKEKPAAWIGGGLGFIYLTAVEALDGYSSEWGFSLSDITANVAGALLGIGQERVWKEQRIRLKYSFTSAPHYKYRPQLLGSRMSDRLLKDYNSQTYWASINIYSFLKEESRFPRWLNIAVGYGADGMIGGTQNPPFDKDGDPYPFFIRSRQYYLSLDIDLTKIKTKSTIIKALAEIISIIKIPAPTLELTNQKLNYYGLYF